MRTTTAVLSILSAAALAPSAASAHEGRQLGPYAVYVGNSIEPTFAREVNGTDFYVLACDVFDCGGNALDTKKGDRVDIKVEVLKLAKPSTHQAVGDGQARVLARAVVGPVKRAPNFEDDEGHYVSEHWLPTREMNHAYHLTGTIQKTGLLPVEVDEYFVCGKVGSAMPGSDWSYFDCVEPPHDRKQMLRFPSAEHYQGK